MIVTAHPTRFDFRPRRPRSLIREYSRSSWRHRQAPCSSAPSHTATPDPLLGAYRHAGFFDLGHDQPRNPVHLVAMIMRIAAIKPDAAVGKHTKSGRCHCPSRSIQISANDFRHPLLLVNSRLSNSGPNTQSDARTAAAGHRPHPWCHRGAFYPGPRSASGASGFHQARPSRAAISSRRGARPAHQGRPAAAREFPTRLNSMYSVRDWQGCRRLFRPLPSRSRGQLSITSSTTGSNVPVRPAAIAAPS